LCIWSGRKETGEFFTTLANRLRLFSENFRFYFTLYCIFMKKIPWLTMLHSDWIGWGSLMWMHVYLAPAWSILCWLRIVSGSLFQGEFLMGPWGWVLCSCGLLNYNGFMLLTWFGMGEEQLDVFVGFRLLVFGSAGSRLTCLAVHWIGWFSPSCLLYVWLLLALGMFVLCFFSMGACSRFCLGYWLPSSLYILFLFATFVAWLPLILIYSYIWSKRRRRWLTKL